MLTAGRRNVYVVPMSMCPGPPRLSFRTLRQRAHEDFDAVGEPAHVVRAAQAATPPPRYKRSEKEKPRWSRRADSNPWPAHYEESRV